MKNIKAHDTCLTIKLKELLNEKFLQLTEPYDWSFRVLMAYRIVIGYPR